MGDQGGSCSDRTSSSANEYTRVDLNNPADENFTVTQLDIWAKTNVGGMETGSFSGSGTDYACAAGHHCSGANMSITLGSCVSKTSGGGDFTAYSASVGEFMGNYYATGTIEKDDFGSGMYYISGDYIPTISTTFTLTADRTLSCYGTGTAEGTEIAGGGGIVRVHGIGTRRWPEPVYET